MKRLVGPLVALVVLFGLGGSAFAATNVDPAKTPGATNAAVTDATVHTNICAPNAKFTTPELSSATKRHVFASYHIANSKRRKYVIDRLVPLELGGTSDVSNLWPQPRSEATTKDLEERSVRNVVCSGKVDLATAQQAFATDWRTATQVVKRKVDANTAALAQYLDGVKKAQEQQALQDYLNSLPKPTLPPSPQRSTCPNGTYVNSAGSTVCSPYASPSGPPTGATAQCRDGTYSFSQSRSGTCSHHGGVAQWF